MPSLGSVVARVRPAARPVFPYVTLGDLRHFGNHDQLGQGAGCLGKSFDPFTVPFVTRTGGDIDVRKVTAVMTDVNAPELDGRRRLLDELDRAAPGLRAAAEVRGLDDASRRAHALLA